MDNQNPTPNDMNQPEQGSSEPQVPPQAPMTPPDQQIPNDPQPAPVQQAESYDVNQQMSTEPQQSAYGTPAVPEQPVQNLEPVTHPVSPSASIYPNPGQTQQMPAQQHELPRTDPGRGLGIASLVTALLGIAPVALILGILGLNKSKKEGFPLNVFALIGTILSAVGVVIVIPILLLTLNNFQSAQAVARDTQNVARLNAVHSKLEEYFNSMNAYPEELSLDLFPGINPNSLTSADGKEILALRGSNSLEDAVSQKPTKSETYIYAPFGCVNSQCTGYVLMAYIEKPTTTLLNPYIKYGLQNP